MVVVPRRDGGFNKVMARYTGPRCRLCCRVGEKLMLKGERCATPKCPIEEGASPPGQRSFRRRKLSDYALRLQEKQKAKYVYGMLEKQFKRFFLQAKRSPGFTGDNLLQLLERRLDNVIYRLGFADSRAQARQLVRHGHILVNGHKVNIPSYLVKPGDVITWREGKAKEAFSPRVSQRLETVIVPSWLSFDKESLSGKVSTLPTRSEIEAKFDEKMIVEYYS